MNLVIYNGSPRKKKSNSKILIEKFLEGYQSGNTQPPVYYIIDDKTKEKALSAFQEADIVLIFFPLYADSMPGIVKEFFENIAQLKKKPKKIGFVVQSGFSESHHSIYLERYLDKLAKRLEIEYLGTVIKGGVEGIQMMPNFMTKKLFTAFEELGVFFAKNNEFSPEIVKKLRKPYKKSFFARFFFQLLKKIGLVNFYWNTQLKSHGSFHKRFDTPYY
jgi:multimeric flavodoxin WrbA